jgi:SsrA-binding protein
MHITPYEQGGYANHSSDRERKLLLNAKELKKLQVATRQKGTTIIPLKLFFNERGLVKLEIAVGVGKKLHDKRETIKQRDTERDMGRKFK